MSVNRPPGMSIRLKLTLSYTGFLIVAGIALFGILLLVLHFLPDENLTQAEPGGGFVPNRGDLLAVARPLFAYGLGFLTIVGLTGGWFLSGQMLRPLEAIAAAARQASKGSLSHRIALPGRDDELRQLADTFDQMLAQLETSFEKQKRFTANVSHELRTPQAVMRTMLQVASSAPQNVDVVKLLNRLDEMNERSIATLEALLLLARVEHGEITRERCYLTEIVEEALELAQDSCPGTDVPITWGRTEPADVVGNRPLLVQLAANLLRNALLHNLPSGGWVQIDVVLEAGHPRLAVANTGPQVTPEIAATLTEPFVRAGGRVRSVGRASGSGLGLAIVASITEAHEAQLVLDPRPEGGLNTSVIFSPEVSNNDNSQRVSDRI
ncbi:VanSc-type vancomycin resistance histidine kinase VanS [Kineosporia mesophila]|uniref:histidine kinase n=1 Tax=Kineosporia mesophila TaxID=566012 RepID=A0ABP7AB18_9ACTN|nr:HAMP domain-containing sensor histidine kinase [Kineosporia mesophila]MCD5351385.1 HAMP domain-containing histidine kinase [Kineosporia mesophila]